MAKADRHLKVVPVVKSSIEGAAVLFRLQRRESFFAAAALIVILLTALSSMPLFGHLQTHYSVSQFLPADHPLLKADLATRERFFLDLSQPVLVTLTLEKGDWLETARLVELARLTKLFTKIEGATDALSLGTVQAAEQTKDQVAMGSLLDIPENERRQRVAADRFLNPLLVSDNGHRSLLMISASSDLSNEVMNRMMDQVRRELTASFPDAKISVGGVPAIQFQLTSLVKTELVRFMGLALVACCLTLLVVFSSFSSVLIPFVAILVTNIFVLDFMVLAGISMTVLASTIPILVSVTVLSLCIHTMLRYVEDAHRGCVIAGRHSAKVNLIVHTLRGLVMPNLLTALTTCFGFATLIMTDVPLIRDFGVAVAVSVMISWACSNLVLAPMLALMPLPTVRGWVVREARWAEWIFRHNRWIVGSVLAGCVVFALIGQNLRWSARLFDDLPKQDETRQATEEIDKGLGGTIPFEIMVDRENQSEPWNDPVAVRALDKILAAVRLMPEVGSAIGLPDLLRMAMGNPSAAVPEQRKSIAESWFMISMAEDSPLKKFLTADGTTTRLGLRLKDVAGDRLEAVMAKIQVQVQASFPDAKITTGGMATTVHRLNNGLSHSLMDGFWEALGVITILLFVVFRSWRWTLTAVLPNLVPAAILIGVLALAQTPIKPGVALVFSIALGIAFNNTVYLLQRLRSLMEESGKSASEEIERTLRLEGNPCLVASLCLLSGFGIFLLSEFGINRTFGAYMLISLFFGLVGDLAFLPALVRLCPWILVSTRKPTAANLNSPVQSPFPEDQMVSEVRQPSLKKVAGIAALFFLFAAVRTSAFAATPTANEILKNVEKGLDSKDERAMIKMKVVESNGSSKERDVEIKRKSGGKNQVLVRLKAPSDVSGVALLSVSQNGSEDQWLYMPSQKKARRIVSGNKNQRFLDTEFNLEDFSAGTYARFENTVVKEERAPSSTIAIIESKSKSNDTSYSKIMTWVDLNSYQLQKSEYYDHGGKLLKTMVFRDYKKFGSTWRAQTIEVRNMQTRRSTVLQMAGLKLNTGLSDREFTQSALETED